MNYQLILLLSTAALLHTSKEILRLGLPSDSGVSPVHLAPGIGGAYSSIPAVSEGPPPKPEWTLLLVKSGTSESSANFEVRLTNISEHTLQLPTGFDARVAVERCPDSRVQVAELSFLFDNHKTLTSFHLYGCKALAKTLISVNPGDWITLTGTYPVALQKEGAKGMSAHFGLVSSHYYQIEKGWIVDKEALLDLSSP